MTIQACDLVIRSLSSSVLHRAPAAHIRASPRVTKASVEAKDTSLEAC